MLEVCNISKSFGDRCALEDINFSLKNGEIVALLGENGAGKSTLLRIMSGFLEPDAGKVCLDEQNIKSNRLYVLQKMAYVQEISSLYGDFSVWEFLQFVAGIRKIEKSEINDKIKHVAELLDLNDVLPQTIETLSKGFKKRVDLAGALLANPQIMLLDEPTEGLDPNQKSAVRKLIQKFAENRIVMISTHTMEDVDKLANRVILIHKGKLISDTNLREFKNIAKNDLSESFKKLTEK